MSGATFVRPFVAEYSSFVALGVANRLISSSFLHVLWYPGSNSTVAILSIHQFIPRSIKTMGSSSQQPLALHLQAAKDKYNLPQEIKPLVLEIQGAKEKQTSMNSKAFSARAIYKKCFSGVSSKRTESECKWRVSVTPDDESGESMQITMLASEDGMVSSTSASSDDSEVHSNVIIKAVGGEKRSSKLGSFFKSSKEGGDDNNETNGQNGDGKDKPNGESNGGGDGGNESHDEKKESPNNNNNNGSENFDPLAYFGPERTSFAQQSTLPLHTGKESDAPTSHPTWTPATGSNFHVRVGPNYVKTGKKEASLDNLYEVYSVRYFRSPCRTIGGATRIMPLPKMMDRCCTQNGDLKIAVDGMEKLNMGGEPTVLKPCNSSHSELKNTKIPDVLVVHFMLPYKDPNMFKQNDDGPGGECVYYLRPTQRFLDEVSGKIAMTPATRLFCRWCHECQNNAEMRGRFKCMALVRDIEKHNFGLLKSYNGKPVLITESGRVCSGFHGDVRYLEMTANGEYTR